METDVEKRCKKTQLGFITSFFYRILTSME